MAIRKENNKIKQVRAENSDKEILPRLNDGMNTPVRGRADTHIPTENEKEMYKQAENPLGNPDRE